MDAQNFHSTEQTHSDRARSRAASAGATTTSDPARVLIMVENLPVPYDRRVWQEATTLARHGHTVSVISPATGAYNALFERLEDVNIYRYPMLIEGRTYIQLMLEYAVSFVSFLWLSLKVAVAGPGFDVVIICNPPDIYWPINALWRLLGKKIIFDHHDLTPEVFIAKFSHDRHPILPVLRFNEYMTFKVAHKVISTNESYREVALARGGKAAEDIVVVRNAPAAGRFRRMPPDPAWKSGAKSLIVYLGEIGEQDGVDVLIRTVRRLRDGLGVNAVHCLILGGGPALEKIKRYAKEQRVASAVTFMGRVDNNVISSVLSSADVAVDPNPYSVHADKSTATKIMEYMFFSLPIVAFDLTETRRSAADSALYAAKGNEEEFAELIIQLLQDRRRRQELGNAGAVRLERELSWSRSAERLVALIDRTSR
jgi:glycosyltransferase involved in cell wall biosynthesis